MKAEQRDIQDIECSIVKNVRLLEELVFRPKTKPELAEALDVSKSTVYYRIDDLEEYGLVEHASGNLQLTTIGGWIAETYLEARSEMEHVYVARTLLQELPDDAVPPRDAVEAGRTVLPRGHPEQVQTEFCEWVRTAEEIRSMLPSASCAFVECVREQVETGGLSIDITTTPATVAYLREHRAGEVQTVIEADSTTVRESADLPSFGLVAMDEPRREAGLVGYSDDGYVSGFMRFPTDEGYRWADEQLPKYTDEWHRETRPSRVGTE